MSILGDDELSVMLSFVPEESDRDSFAFVSKQWLRIEDLSRLSIRVHEPNSLQNFLPRFPNLRAFTSPALLTDAHLELVAKTCPKLETLKLNFKPTLEIFDGVDSESGFDDFGDDGVRAIANGCPNLSEISLRRRKNIVSLGVMSLVDNINIAQKLTCLDLRGCTLIGDRALEAIGRLSSILVLKLNGCSLITDKGLVFLTQGSCSKSLRTLFVAECDGITDWGVSHLDKMSCLEELSLGKCGPKVTDVGGRAIATIKTLKRLDLSLLFSISNTTIHAIAEHCKDLVELILLGCKNVTGTGLYGFENHEHLETLVLSSGGHFSWNDLQVLFQCQSLKYVLLDRGLRERMPAALRDNVTAYRVQVIDEPHY